MQSEMNPIMDNKCKNCKYLKNDMDFWTYQPYHYCSLLKDGKERIECEEYKNKYTIKDYFEETWFGWLVISIIIMINIISVL